MHKAALVCSSVFHPLMMPLGCLYLAAKFDWYLQGMMPPEQMNVVFVVVALSTIAFPGINLLLLRWSGVISSLQLPIRSERTVPFLSTFFFFALGYYILRKGQLPVPFYSIYIGCLAALLLITAINKHWKISVHAAGIAGLAGTLIALFQLHAFANLLLLAIVFLAIGATMSSRLILKVHTPAQVYFGAILGFSTLYVSVVYGIAI